MLRAHIVMNARHDAMRTGSVVAREGVILLGGCLILAVAAHVYVPLPFTPVAIGAQTFVVGLLGALCGSKRGAATTVTYILLGVMGLPVFAGGATGLSRLFGPTAGYLVAYVPAAYVVGILIEGGWHRRGLSIAASLTIGHAIIYIAGIVWLQRFLGWTSVWKAGVLPFLPGDIVKVIVATAILPALWSAVGAHVRVRPE